MSDWACTVCTLINISKDTKCDACGSPKPEDKHKTPSKPQGSNDTEWACSFCTLINQPKDTKCDACGEPRSGQPKKQASSQPAQPAKPANGAKQEPAKPAQPSKPEPTKLAPPQPKQVANLRESNSSIRSSADSVDDLASSAEYALTSSQEIFDDDDELFFGSGAVDGKGPELVMDPEKNPNDIDQEIAFLPPVNEVRALSFLNPMQAKAVSYVVQKSKKDSETAFPRVLNRVKSLGYTQDDLKKTLRYIRDEAPIIIHVMLDTVLQFLIKDTHYRNQFETKTSRGTLNEGIRTNWENRLFNKIYDKSTPFERVKYGVLNIVKDIKGVHCCYHYGDSYMVLKNVRLRTTFANKDSGYEDAKLSCCEYYSNVLDDYTDQELKAVIDIAIGKVTAGSSSVIGQYKEVQIHGTVELTRDVETLVVNPRHKSDKNLCKMIDQFCAKTNCKLVWMP